MSALHRGGTESDKKDREKMLTSLVMPVGPNAAPALVHGAMVKAS